MLVCFLFSGIFLSIFLPLDIKILLDLNRKHTDLESGNLHSVLSDEP